MHVILFDTTRSRLCITCALVIWNLAHVSVLLLEHFVLRLAVENRANTHDVLVPQYL